jgi:nicotinate-nucleotide adenylyltransferase
MAHTIVYGGTFDPIHHGHLITCQKARELLGADRVLFIPAGISPHKTMRQTGATGDQRLAMIKLAIAEAPAPHYFAVDDRELLREGPSYTADTLDELERESRALEPGKAGERFTLLIGVDQLGKFHTWHRIQDILVESQTRGVAILGRPGDHAVDDALTEFAAHLGLPIADRLAKAILPTPLIDISATDIRERIAGNLPVDYLVPASVAAYIREHHLYRGSPGR